MEDDTRRALGELIKEIRSHFFVPPAPQSVVPKLAEETSHLGPSLEPIATAFTHNLEGAVGVASIPFVFASSGVHRLHHQRIHMAERIRAGNIEPESGESEENLERRRDREAARIAGERTDKFVASPSGQDVVIRDTCTFLLDALETGLKDAAAELVNQATVLLWGAFEVLARDAFVAFVNSNPAAVQRLLSDPTARRRFDISKISLDVLAAHNFNVSTQMGEILASQQDMSDLLTIRAVYGALFPGDAELLRTLNDRGLWLLSHDRHLIVHRRATVDARYVEATGSNLLPGRQRHIAPAEFEEYLNLVRDAGGSVLIAVNNSGGDGTLSRRSGLEPAG